MTMLKTKHGIHGDVETRCQLNGTCKDKNDLIPSTGKGQQQLVILNNIREVTIPLDFSDTAQDDSCCVRTFNFITATMEKDWPTRNGSKVWSPL